MKKKLISFFMIAVLLVSLIQGGAGSIASASGGNSGEYTELSLDDFGINTYKDMITDGETVQTESKASLNGMAITGVFNFQGAAQLFIGENWHAVTVTISDNTLCMYPTLLGNTNTTGMYIGASELGYESLLGQNIEIRMTFDFKNISGDKADVIVKAIVDDKVAKEMTLEQATTTTLYQSIGVYLPDANSKVTMTEPEYLIQKLTLRDFGVDTYKEMKTDGESIQTESKATLDGTAITGVYNFKGAAQLFIGEGWHAVTVTVSDNTLCMFPTLLDNTTTAGMYFAASEFGYESLLDKNLEIQMTFDFKNISGEKADVVVMATVDDRLTKEMTLTQATTTTLYQNLSVYLPDADSSVTVMTTEYAITELTLEDFGVVANKAMTTDGDCIQTESKGTLDGTAVTGIYHIDGNAQVFIGENWHAVTIAVDNVNGAVCVLPTLLGNTNTDAALYFHLSDFEYTSWAERDIKVRVAFDFKNISGEKADVIVKVTVDDLVTKEMTLIQATTTTLYQNVGVYLPDANSTVTLTNPDYKPVVEYDELSLKDFGISHSKIIKTDGTVVKTTSEELLDGKAVTGKYKLSGGAQFFIGESWKGLQVSVYSDPSTSPPTPETLCIVPYALNHSNNAALYFALSEFENYASWKDRDIKIRAAFEFENASGDKADVIVKITIDDVVTKTMILEDADVAPLCQSIGVYLPNGSTITMSEPNPDPEPTYEPFTPEDYGFKGYTLVNDETVLKELSSEKTLDGTCITGDYKFSPNGSIVCFGGYWTGVRIQSLDNGKFEVRFQLEGVEQYVDDVFNNIILTPEDAGMTLTDRIINLKMGFEVIKQEGTMGTLVARMTIDNSFTQQYTFENVPLAYTKQIMMAWSSTDGAVILNASSPIPEAPTVNPGFKQLTFDSYLIYSDEYGYDGSNDLSASGHCGLNSLDKVVFSDTINITDKPGANLYIGGKTNGWEGLLLGSAENGNLVLVYDGKSILFTSAKAGVKLTDNDVKITFSFEYVDADDDGQKDDVKLGVWFNGKAYNNRWIYLNDYADKLGGFIGVYSAVEGAALTVKTYNAPIDFAEWGFTKDWAKTLGLV